MACTWMTWRAQQTQWSSWCCQISWDSGSLWNSLFPDRAMTCCSKPWQKIRTERKLNRNAEGRFQTSNHHSSSFLNIEQRCTLTVPWQLPKGWERTAAGTGWIRPCWKKRTKRTNRSPVPGFYWKRGKMVQESHPLWRQRDPIANKNPILAVWIYLFICCDFPSVTWLVLVQTVRFWPIAKHSLLTAPRLPGTHLVIGGIPAVSLCRGAQKNKTHKC